MLREGVDPLWQLRQPQRQGGHPYKLPKKPENTVVRLVWLDIKDVKGLLIHDYMIADDWMQQRNLVPAPRSPVMCNLARTALDRGYFKSGRGDIQVRHYHNWQTQRSLENAIPASDPIFIEHVGKEEYEIVDGWGRVLPFVALLLEGCSFHKVASFVALPNEHL